MKPPSRSPKTPGRPRKYPAHLARDGAPHLTVRLAPEQLERVRELGGSPWVRSLIEKALADRELEASLARALNAPAPTAPDLPRKPRKARTPQPPPASPSGGQQMMQVRAWLAVENNNKFVRGKRKAQEEIERFVLARYLVKKPDPKGCEYILKIPYTTDQDLEDTIHDLFAQAENFADLRHCFLECDAVSLEDPERSW